MTTLFDLSVKYPDLLLGQKKETESDLLAVETALNIQLPEDVRWYLLECGYGTVNAIPNIRTSIADPEVPRCGWTQLSLRRVERHGRFRCGATRHTLRDGSRAMGGLANCRIAAERR